METSSSIAWRGSVSSFSSSTSSPRSPRRRTSSSRCDWRRRAPSIRAKRRKELLELVGMTQRATHRPDELSGGEQQRVAIGVALANDPPLLLADEPTGELDTKTGQEVLDLFRRLNQEFKKTIVVVTHDARVSHIAHRVLEIQDGKIMGETPAA